jgi:hypothetical protein
LLSLGYGCGLRAGGMVRTDDDREVEFGDVPVRVEVYSGEETTEIFIEMVFETLPGRISEKTGRHGCQQAHMLASTRRRPIVVARRWRIIRRSIIRRGCVVGWPGGRPPRRCQTGRAGGQVGKRG